MCEVVDIAEKLKDAPKGTELYCTILDEVKLISVDLTRTDYPIKVESTRDDCYNDEILTRYGKLYMGQPDSECILFPSKDMRDWQCVNFKEDLPAGTLCLVADTKDFIRCDGSLEVCLGNIRIYKGKGRCRADHESDVTFAWNHIIPISEIDFNNPIYNKNHDYGKSVD